MFMFNTHKQYVANYTETDEKYVCYFKYWKNDTVPFQQILLLCMWMMRLLFAAIQRVRVISISAQTDDAFTANGCAMEWKTVHWETTNYQLYAVSCCSL